MGALKGLASFLVCWLVCDANTPDKPPHIVIIVADDLGWSDVSFHGSYQIPTPNIDVIAKDGIMLNQYYVSPVCSPSRTALMTGKYPIRTGSQHSVIVAGAPWGLPLNETILPEYLKSLGYATHAVGKWHLGFFQEEYLPLKRGFDSFFGYYNGVKDYYTHFSEGINQMRGLDLVDNYDSDWGYNGTYGTELFTAKAKNVILNHDPEKPLFLYLAQQAPHSGNFRDEPLQVPSKYTEHLSGIDDPKRKLFAGMVLALDESVGDIFDALYQSNMLSNTIFIFTTDNGGAVRGMQDRTPGSNWPLRGAKYTLFEGGTRGNAFVWSDLLGNRKHDGLMHITDWLPTLLSAAGGPQAVAMLDSDVDGVDQWRTLAYNEPHPRTDILLNIDDVMNATAIRRGKFKLISGTQTDEAYHGWYDVEGKRISNESVPELSPSKEMEYAKNYAYHMSRSKAARVLLSTGRMKHPWNSTADCDTPNCTDLRVECGPRHLINSCDPERAPCLFNLHKDPCEFHNIADLHPEVVAELESAVDEYRTVMVPSLYTAVDPASDPILHDNAWKPWM